MLVGPCHRAIQEQFDALSVPIGGFPGEPFTIRSHVESSYIEADDIDTSVISEAREKLVEHMVSSRRWKCLDDFVRAFSGRSDPKASIVLSVGGRLDEAFEVIEKLSVSVWHYEKDKGGHSAHSDYPGFIQRFNEAYDPSYRALAGQVVAALSAVDVKVKALSELRGGKRVAGASGLKVISGRCRC